MAVVAPKRGNGIPVSGDLVTYEIAVNKDTHTIYYRGGDEAIHALSISNNGGIVSKTTTYTATTDYEVDHIIFCNGTFTVDLPDITSTDGIKKIIKNIGTGTITIDGYSTQTIDGSTTLAMSTQYETVCIISNAGNWHVL